MRSYGKIPGPFGLPIVGNLFSFASFTPKAHLTWTAWARTFGKIYKYVPHPASDLPRIPTSEMGMPALQHVRKLACTDLLQTQQQLALESEAGFGAAFLSILTQTGGSKLYLASSSCV